MKRIMTLLLLAAGLFALDVGQTGLNHLRIQPDARMQGMGGISLGLADNPKAFFANPAALSDERMLTADYLPYPAGVHVGALSFKPAPYQKLRYSVTAFYLNSGQMTRTSPTNQELGTFAYHVINLGGSAAYPVIENLSIGASLVAHLAAADSNVQVGVAGDIGVLAHDFLPGLAVGLTAENLSYEIMPFVEERSAMPLGIGGGVSYAGVKNLLLGIDVSKPFDAPLIVRGGAEFLPVDILALRLGYSTGGTAWKIGEGADIIAGLSGGIGIRDVAGVSVDYAVTPALDLGIFHRISLSYRF